MSRGKGAPHVGGTGDKRRRRLPLQLELPLTRGWGGVRTGAGRKAAPGRRRVPHRARPAHARGNPVHATLRAAFRPLRSQTVFPTIRGAIADHNRRRSAAFRVVHFSVQYDHLHLIVEAADASALSSGLRGLAVSIARRVNRLAMRRGRFWADRWHGHTLTTPRAVRHALVYVLGNFAKHSAEQTTLVDPYSSAPYFTDFREHPGSAPWSVDPSVIPRALAPPSQAPVPPPASWLLRVGYQRRGRVSLCERPKRAAS